MKKFALILLAAIMLLTLAGCGKENEQIAALQTQLEELKTENQELNERLTQLQNAPVPNTVYASNATINGETTVEFTGEAKFTALAALEEGYVVDHWKINAEVQPESKADTFVFSAAADTWLEAVIRPEKKVTTINAEMQFLDEKGKVGGDPFTEFVFEEDYIHPLTQQTVEGGKITIRVKAVIPSGYVVDYWLINGIRYDFTNTVNSFTVTELTEATVYEVVLKEKPDVYYDVLCEHCTYNGKTDFKVKAGTKITVTGQKGYSYNVYVNDVKVNTSLVNSYTLTIKEDTEIYFGVVIN